MQNLMRQTQMLREDRTILLVDDNENDLFLMLTAFEEAGYKGPLREAHNGEEAIAFLQATESFLGRDVPALMLLDLNMPKKDGFEVLEWVRADPNFRRLPIIILSASMRPQDIERAFDLGANAFLVKPTTIEGLTKMIRSLGDWMQYNRFPRLGASVGT